MPSTQVAGLRRENAIKELQEIAEQLSTRYNVVNTVSDVDTTYIHLESDNREMSAAYQAKTAEMHLAIVKLFQSCLDSLGAAAESPLG